MREKPDTGIYIVGGSSVVVRSVEEIESVMNVGDKNRAVRSVRCYTSFSNYTKRSFKLYKKKLMARSKLTNRLTHFFVLCSVVNFFYLFALLNP